MRLGDNYINPFGRDGWTLANTTESDPSNSMRLGDNYINPFGRGGWIFANTTECDPFVFSFCPRFQFVLFN